MVCWVSIIVFCAAVLRVAENLPLEDDISELKYPSSENAFSDEEKELGDALSRDKRTIGFLRQIFPGLSQIVDRKIQMLTRLAFRLIGRLVLRGGAGGGGGGTGTASSGDSGRKVSITLPTYPPSVDDDEDEDEDSDGDSSTVATTTTSSEDDTTIAATTEASDLENQVAESKVSEVKVRKTRDAEKVNKASGDQEPAATGDNDNDNDLDSSDSAVDSDGEGSEDSPRNKRLLNFNLGGGGSGGGSGNFLFDIIRLVAGSGTTQEKDEAENAPLEDGSAVASDAGLTGKDDGYSAGVPGPLTRLFVIANRGIANLIQDLILRLAQTSERIVNFKARLITSII